MTDLSELLEELAGAPGPPSRLRPADIYTQGRRRHGRTVAATVAAVSAAVVALVAGAALVASGGGSARPAPAGDPTGPPGPTSPTSPTSPAGPAGQSSQAVRSPDGLIAAAAAGDASHLYAVVLDCANVPAEPPPDWYSCRRNLLRSADAGRTWQLRGRDIGAFDSIDLTALSADVLMARAEKLITPGTLPEAGLYVSVNGGQTWKRVVRQETPVPAVAAGGWIDWGDQPDEFLTVDPGLARSARLTGQPALAFSGPAVRTAAGALWVAGTDGQGGRPVVAVSVDAGRTWSTHVFDDVPPAASSGYSVGTTTMDGTTGYAVTVSGYGLDGGGKVWVHRTGDGGRTWQRVDLGGSAPWSYGGGLSYLTPDGAHVVIDLGRDGKRAYWISRDGGGQYRQVTLEGLPENVAGVPRPAPGGGYLAYTDDAVYLSTDGLQWRRAVPHAP